MDPITILITTVVSSVGGYAIARLSTSRTPQTNSNRSPSTAPRSGGKTRRRRLKWPSRLPRITLSIFVTRWWKRVQEMLGKETRPSLRVQPAASTAPQQSIKALNRTKPLFEIAGPLVLLWGLVDAGLALADAGRGPAWLSDSAAPVMAAAAIGFWTNYLALKMLFHPRAPGWVFWHGVLPARQDELAELIAEAVAEHLVNAEAVETYLASSNAIANTVGTFHQVSMSLVTDPAFKQDVSGLVYGYCHAFVTKPAFKRDVVGFVRRHIQALTGSSLIARLTRRLWEPQVEAELATLVANLPTHIEKVLLPKLEARLARIPAWLETNKESVHRSITAVIVEAAGRLDVTELVAKQIRDLPVERVETMLTGPMSEELEFVQVGGGIFGLLAGLALVSVPARVVLASVGLGIVAHYVFWRRQRGPSD